MLLTHLFYYFHVLKTHSTIRLIVYLIIIINFDDVFEM